MTSRKPTLADSNLDGEFNSSDFVTVFKAGEYEDGIEMNSGWAEGDWNGDGDFSSRDLVFRISAGRFRRRTTCCGGCSGAVKRYLASCDVRFHRAATFPQMTVGHDQAPRRSGKPAPAMQKCRSGASLDRGLHRAEGPTVCLAYGKPVRVLRATAQPWVETLQRSSVERAI